MNKMSMRLWKNLASEGESIQIELWAEGLKMLRSKMLWITIILIVFQQLMGGALIFVVKNPEFSRSIGLLGSAGKVNGTPDWPFYFSLLAQMMPQIGLIAFSFIAAWIFGREYADRTAKDLLALPVSRISIVIAKLITLGTWCLVLAFVSCALALAIGIFLQLSLWSTGNVFHSLSILYGASLFCILLCTPIAFLASYTRGYMAPIGFIMVVLFLGNIVGILGYASYYPWSAPILFAMKGIAGESAEAISLLVMGLASIIGFLATTAWWRFADQT